ncbi:MAG: TIGR02281 family clan AA aspartic protease [Burkholderiaceae bacterium]
MTDQQNVSEKKDDGRRIGAWMMIGAWVLLIGLGTLLLNRYMERSRNPNNEVVTTEYGGKRSITLQRGRHGHYVVTGTINGYQAEFLVDTGASSVSVPVDVADGAGLTRGAPIKINTANGIGTAYATRIDRLRIGELEVRNVTAHVNPGLSDAVLLGMSVLKHYELIQRGDKLIIREP